MKILAFESIDQRVRLRAEGVWAAGATPEKTAAAVTFEEERPLGESPDAEAIARNLSALLNEFAKELALALADVNTL